MRVARLRRRCLTCHDVHGSPNADLVRPTIRFDSRLHPIAFDAAGGAVPGGFVDPANPGRGLCETCHKTTKFYRADGCAACEHSGYRGRLGIYEMLQMDTTLREMTFRGEPMVHLRDYAWQSGGMSTLLQDGVRKVMAGYTTIPELLRVVAAV